MRRIDFTDVIMVWTELKLLLQRTKEQGLIKWQTYIILKF
jgi:hypothetical protein